MGRLTHIISRAKFLYEFIFLYSVSQIYLTFTLTLFCLPLISFRITLTKLFLCDKAISLFLCLMSFSDFTLKMGHDFLDILYVQEVVTHFV